MARLATMPSSMCTHPWKVGFRLLAPAALLLIVSLNGCSPGRYMLLSEAEKDEVEQLKENVYRVEYRMNVLTSQDQLDLYLRRRCAELTLRERYDFFHLTQRADVLGLSRRTAMTVTMYKGHKPAGVANLYDAKAVLAESAPLKGK